MKALAWIGAYMVTLVLEVSFLPGFFGTGVPALHMAVLLLGIAFQDFWPGLWFSGLAGFSRDVLVPGSGGAETMTALLVFFAMRLFLAFDLFAMPFERMGAVLAGLFMVPVGSSIASHLARTAFGASIPSFQGRDLLSSVALRESMFAIVWFLAAAWLTARFYGRRRRDAMSRLR